jgi:hypothetical protein
VLWSSNLQQKRGVVKHHFKLIFYFDKYILCVLWSSNLQQKREVVRNHSEDEEMESQEEEEESFGKFTPKEYRRDVSDRSSINPLPSP